MTTYASGINKTVMDNFTQNNDVRTLAQEFLIYKIGDFVNNYYSPIFIPIGVLGNFLSFLVMVQKHNRHSSMSVYLAVLTIPDTILLCHGLTSHLAMVHNVYMPPGQKWHCKITCLVNFISYLWSTLLILNMTFDRFYSIIRPHKAASFNTVKRAKITVVCVIMISVLYNSPHFFVASNVNWDCVPYGAALGNVLGEIYYWLSFVVQFALPFVLLLFMNSVIIHKIRTRSAFTHEGVSSGDSSNSGDQLKTKNPESQMFAILLLVTFTFMILTTPSYGFFLYVRIFDFSKTPRRFAGYYMFYNVAHKMQISGHGINFFLYVISGQKFRTDLRKLFSFLNVAKGNKGAVITLSEKVTSSEPSVG